MNRYTNANYEMQIAAHEALEKGLYELDRRQGYRGPIKHLAPDEIEAVSNELAKQTDETPLQEGVSIKGIVTSLDKKNNNVIVRIGNIFGVINFEDMKWARKPDPDSEYYEQTIRNPGEIFKAGDLILVKTKQKIRAKGVKNKKFWTLPLDKKPKAESAVY